MTISLHPADLVTGDLLQVTRQRAVAYSEEFQGKEVGPFVKGTYLIFLQRSKRFQFEVWCLTPAGAACVHVSDLVCVKRDKNGPGVG